MAKLLPDVKKRPKILVKSKRGGVYLPHKINKINLL